MPNYAIVADVEAYIEGWTTLNESVLNRLIDKAELDIDAVCGPWPVDVTTDRKFGSPNAASSPTNPRGLTEPQKKALKRATCAQVEFRFTMGEAHFVGPVFEDVTGPDFSTKGRAAMFAPKARRELVGSGLVITGVRAVA